MLIHPYFPGHKLKAITFSFDDGVKQDEKIIAILDKYHLKATFNLNSERFGSLDEMKDKKVRRDRIIKEDIQRIYQAHEVAAHTCSHTKLTTLSEAEIIQEVNDDVKTLSALIGHPVVGLAYPCGGINFDERVMAVIKNHTSIQYARTTISTGKFDLPSHILSVNPSVYLRDEQLFEIVKGFLNLETSTPKILYIWGHGYELDFTDEFISWDVFEKLCQLVANREEIFYGTNQEIFSAIGLIK